MSKVKRFRRKPVEVEAMVYRNNEKDARAVVGWICKEPGWKPAVPGDVRAYYDGHCLVIGTLEGAMHAKDGDWIVKGVEGEFWPVKPRIFKKTYEAV